MIKIILIAFVLYPLCINALNYFTNDTYPGILLVEGVFEPNDVEGVSIYIEEVPTIHTVMLNSRGGNLFSSIEVGNLIRENGIATLVPENGICYSACTYAFMGGLARTIGEGASFAMHRPYFSEEMDGKYTDGYNSGIITSVMVVSYLIEMGLDPLTASFHLLSKDLAHFTPRQQKELNIITTHK